MSTTVLLAGATGMLGHRIARHLLDQPDVAVRLLIRRGSLQDPVKAQEVMALERHGGVTVIGDVTEPTSLDHATAGADVVVSALQGGTDVIVDGQIALAEAAVRNGARRFLPSDYAIDLFLAPDGAPMFDLRKQAARAIDAMPIEVAHVLNGAFMDTMLDPKTGGLIDVRQGTATLWGTGDEPFNLTTVEDTARFTAGVATDPVDVSGVRYVSGAESTFNTIIAETERLTGATLTRNVLGGVEDLRRITAAATNPWSVIGEWYFLCMLTVRPFPTTDNDRYPGAYPTGLRDYLTAAHQALRQS